MYNTKMYTRENYTSTLYRAKILVFCDKYRKKAYIKAYKTKRIHICIQEVQF